MEYPLFALNLAAKRLLNWRIVRGVAELSILTNASYFMLIFVPILAGLWPGVRLYVNNHNEAVIEATEVLESYSLAFDKSRESLKNFIDHVIEEKVVNPTYQQELQNTVSEIDSNSDKFSEDVKDFTDDFIPKTLDEPSLPWAWAAAFFASLFAVVAHLFYQLFAPENLRRFTLDEFVKDKKEDYAKHPSEESLKRSRNYLATREGRSESDIDEHRAYRLYKKIHAEIINLADKGDQYRVFSRLSLSELSSLITLIQQETDLPDSGVMLDLAQEALSRNSEKIGLSDVEKQKNMTIIERGARAEYLYWAGRNIILAAITALMYGVAIFIIFEIISLQAGNVMNMAGWESILNLFSFGD